MLRCLPQHVNSDGRQGMRFIQVGVGGMGRHWSTVLEENRRAKVVGLVDIKREAMREACDKHGHSESICFTSLEEALSRVDADALVCVTPPASHREVTVAGLRAGLNVITEKPMAETMADCRAMLRASAR